MLLNLLLIWSLEIGMKGPSIMIENPTEITPTQYIIPEVGINFNGILLIGFINIEGDVIIKEYFKFDYGLKILVDKDFYNFGLIYNYNKLNNSDEIKIFAKLKSN